MVQLTESLEKLFFTIPSVAGSVAQSCPSEALSTVGKQDDMLMAF